MLRGPLQRGRSQRPRRTGGRISRRRESTARAGHPKGTPLGFRRHAFRERRGPSLTNPRVKITSTNIQYIQYIRPNPACRTTTGPHKGGLYLTPSTEKQAG